LIPAAEYRQRRDRLLQMLAPDAAALVPAAPRQWRNRDAAWPYRQSSDFYYLTGFTEPDALLVLLPSREGGRTILFCADQDAEDPRLHGGLLGPEQAVTELGVDDAFPINDLDDILPGLLEPVTQVHIDLGVDAAFDQHLIAAQLLGKAETLPLGPQLHELRLFKSAAELRLLRRAAEISAAAHCRLIQMAKPGVTEAQLEAELLYSFMSQGARYPAFPSIVATGANACIWHYTGQASALADGDLVLIDAGCEYQYYASDISRTFPANGRFSDRQRALYELVLAAHSAAIAAIRPGATIACPQRAARAVLADGLCQLGVLSGPAEAVLASGADLRFSAPRSSHWLGLDVHDVGDYQLGDAARLLEPQMVLTVEPGLYLPDAPDVPAAWRGMAVRIEDEVLVTRRGAELLTDAAPRTIADIEALMR
jgi:Xaa-Pro aminopeptidase